MGPSAHLRFLLAKQQRFDQNYKSLLVPDLSYRFVQAKHRDYHLKTSVYGSQTSPVDLCMQNSVISIRITSL